MDSLTLSPIREIRGDVALPGSKSVSNRALLLAALAAGETGLTNLLDADDVRHMLTALRALGVSYRLAENRTQCSITGQSGPLTAAAPLELYLGNAGTAMRPLCAALCLGQGQFTLTGEPRMTERPIGDLVDALAQAGADIRYLANPGYPPLRIDAHGLRGGGLSIRGNTSSQFLSALLMAAPLAQSDTRITVEGELVSKPYVALTLTLMRRFGVQVDTDSYQVFEIPAGQRYRAVSDYFVEGDASSASYFLAAAAIRGHSRVYGVGRHSLQGDVQFAHVLEKMGAKVSYEDNFIEVSSGPLTGIDMDMNHIPDAAMTIAVVALFAKGRTVIRNIENWRVKETDRLAAMAAELRKVGAEVVEGRDFLQIDPPAAIKHAQIKTYDDHRIAMCFSLLALDPASVTILDPNCVSKTFPDYFQVLESVSVR